MLHTRHCTRFFLKNAPSDLTRKKIYLIVVMNQMALWKTDKLQTSLFFRRVRVGYHWIVLLKRINFYRKIFFLSALLLELLMFFPLSFWFFCGFLSFFLSARSSFHFSRFFLPLLLFSSSFLAFSSLYPHSSSFSLQVGVGFIQLRQRRWQTKNFPLYFLKIFSMKSHSSTSPIPNFFIFVLIISILIEICVILIPGKFMLTMGDRIK